MGTQGTQVEGDIKSSQMRKESRKTASKKSYKNITDLARWETQIMLSEDLGTQGNSGELSEGLRGAHGELRELKPPILENSGRNS